MSELKSKELKMAKHRVGRSTGNADRILGPL